MRASARLGTRRVDQEISGKGRLDSSKHGVPIGEKGGRNPGGEADLIFFSVL